MAKFLFTFIFIFIYFSFGISVMNHFQQAFVLKGWRAAIAVGTNNGPLTSISNS